MSNNTALVTSAAQQAAEVTLQDYANGVSAHINGDWGKHNQLRVYATEFDEPSSGDTVSPLSLRMALSDDDASVAVLVPVLATAVTPTVGSAPTIITQPQDASVAAGDPVTLTVVAASAYAMTFQWKKAGVEIDGATSAQLVIPAATAADDQGTYSVDITNAYGTTSSEDATITVS